MSRVFDFNNWYMGRTDNAESCMYSRKEIRNRSVYCLKQEKWVSVNYCQQCEQFIEESK